MNEIQLRVDSYIYREEMQTTTLGKSQTKKKSGPQHEDRPRKETRTSRVERYHDYTPFNIPLAEGFMSKG